MEPGTLVFSYMMLEWGMLSHNTWLMSTNWQSKSLRFFSVFLGRFFSICSSLAVTMCLHNIKRLQSDFLTFVIMKRRSHPVISRIMNNVSHKKTKKALSSQTANVFWKWAELNGANSLPLESHAFSIYGVLQTHYFSYGVTPTIHFKWRSKMETDHRKRA